MPSMQNVKNGPRSQTECDWSWDVLGLLGHSSNHPGRPSLHCNSWRRDCKKRKGSSLLILASGEVALYF